MRLYYEVAAYYSSGVIASYTANIAVKKFGYHVLHAPFMIFPPRFPDRRLFAFAFAFSFDFLFLFFADFASQTPTASRAVFFTPGR